MEAWVTVLAALCVCCLVSVCAAFAWAAFAWGGSGNRSNQSMNSAASVRDQVDDSKPAICPTRFGYHNCTDDQFNTGLQPGVAEVLDKKLGYDSKKKGSLGAKHLCCKYANATGDERPEVRAKVRSQQKKVFILNLVVQLVTAFLPLGILASVATEMAFTGVDIALSELGQQPYMSCQNIWGGSSDDIVAHDFKNEAGEQVFQLFQTKNGCPVRAGLPKEIEYSVEVGKALEGVGRAVQGGLGEVNESNLEIMPFDKFVASYENVQRKPISCYLTCERDRVGLCKCADCAGYDTEGGGNCQTCRKVKGEGKWRCDQTGGNGYKDF